MFTPRDQTTDVLVMLGNDHGAANKADDDQCRQVLVQFPSSKFAKQAEQLLRNVQEVIAAKEFLAGDFYHHKGSFPAAANRFSYLSQQYPLYSAADEALYAAKRAGKNVVVATAPAARVT